MQRQMRDIPFRLKQKNATFEFINQLKVSPVITVTRKSFALAKKCNTFLCVMSAEYQLSNNVDEIIVLKC